jgi:spermidine synthase
MEYIQEVSESDARTAYGVTKRVYEGRTTVGTDVVIADSPAYGRMLFLDGELQSASADEHLYHEALVHPAMAGVVFDACPARLSVLVVGGGEGATVREVLRWSQVQRVMWVDWDGELVDQCRSHLGWAPSVYENSRVEYHPCDIRAAWPWMTDFDVIILDLPDPDLDDVRDDPSALYGPAFWELLKPHGAIVSHAGPVIPGGREEERRAGLAHIKKMAAAHGFDGGSSYHATIPSFQNVWGFWMSVHPSHHSEFPISCVVMDSITQRQAFTWPRYWHALA